MAGKVIPHVYLGPDSMITSLGFSTEAAIEAICTNRSGCRTVDDRQLYGEPFIAGVIDAERLAETAAGAGLDGFTRLEQLFILTAGDVVRRSGIDPADRRTLLIISTTKGNIDLLGQGPRPDEKVWLDVMAARVGRALGFTERPLVISNACISGVSAMIVGARLIEEGEYDDVVVAGGDLVTRFTTTGFHAFKSVSQLLCRPYDAARDGLTLGEGAAAVLLTSQRQKAGQAAIEIAGGGISNDANHISGPSRTGDGLYYAIRQAAEQGGLREGMKGCVNGHGTATVFNDEMEGKAFRLAGIDDLPLNSFKPWFGHTLGASGVIETIVAAHQLRRGVVFGTPGFETSGTTCQLDVSSAHREMALDYCIKTASGFGGCNAAVLLKKANGTQEDRTTPGTEVNITETARCVITPSGEPFHDEIRRMFRELDSPDMKFFKMDDLCKLGYVAAGKLLAESGIAGKYPPEKIGIILSNRSASLDTDMKHQRIIDEDATGGASPSVFVYTLPNLAAAEVCIKHKIQGENTFFIEDGSDGFVGKYARMLLKNGYLSALIFGRCELLGEDYGAELTLLETQI